MTRNKTATTIALFLILAMAVSLIASPFANAQSDLIMQVNSTVLTGIGNRIRLNGGPGPGYDIELWVKSPGDTEFQYIWTGTTTTPSWFGGALDYYDFDFAVTGVYQMYWAYPVNTSISNIATVTAIEPIIVEFPSFCIVNAAPNPVGIGQSMFLNVFMSVPIIGATMSIGGTTGNHYMDMYVDITRPDGVKETFGPFVSDPTGGFWMSYTPATTGNYTAQGRFLGQDVREDTGGPMTEGLNKIVYLPSESSILTFTVQEEPVGGWAQPPLPTEYWSRPIYATNWDWGTLVGSNWWGFNSPSFSNTGGYDATGNVQPYGTAPNSPHIMWTKSTAPGGQPGGTIASDQEGQFTSTSIMRHHWEPIIVYGIVFYDLYPSASTPSGVDSPKTWVAVDIRTGETLWEKTRGITGSETLRGGWIQKFHSVQEYGSWGALFATGSGSMGYVYDLLTGMHMANVTHVSWGSTIVDDHPDDYRNQGGMLRYYVTGGSLTCWNSTMLWTNGASGQRDWRDAYEWQVPMSDYPEGTPSSVRVTSNEVLLLSSLPAYLGGFSGYQKQGYITVAGVSARTGKLLWGPLNHTLREKEDISMYGARDGAAVLVNKDRLEVYGISLHDGSMWGPVKLPSNATNAWSHIELDAEVYGDVVVYWDFGGNVIGLDKESGEILWTYSRGPSGYETPYGIYPLWDFGSESFADGKAFFSEGSMYDVPLHPARRVAINVTTGEEVWSILSYSGRCPGAIADGYLLEWDSHSNEIVCFGKGPTQTAVAAGPEVSVYGSKVVVKGMVTDVSPGTEAYNREARFPNGVPAVSDESQREWMEYVYMQQAKPADATGVDVTISVFDPNGNTYDVGTTTSNGDGFYTMTFTPEVPGEYVVTATFCGSESYWGSFAQTSLFVEEAPAATPAPTPTPAPMTDTYVTGFGIGIIIAIVVVGLLLFLMLRKR